MTSVVKSCGQHLKAPIALVRLRLYETLSQIPAQDFEGNIILFLPYLLYSKKYLLFATIIFYGNKLYSYENQINIL